MPTQVEAILGGRREGGRHLGGGADDSDDNETDEGWRHTQCSSCDLHGGHEDLANDRDEDRHQREGEQGDFDRPGPLIRLTMAGTCEDLLVGLQGKHQRQPIANNQQAREPQAEGLGDGLPSVHLGNE